MRSLPSTDVLFDRPLEAGDVVACLTLYSGGPTWERCVTSLLTHTPDDVPVVVFDDAGPSHQALEQLADVESRLGRELFFHRQPRNLGVVGNLNSAFDLLSPADVIVLNSDIVVGPEWAERLIAAARSRTDIATATAFSTNASIFTVRGQDSWSAVTPSVEEFGAVARQIAETSTLIRPFVPVATSFCTLFARTALNVVGHLDEEYSPGYGEEVDYSLRCVAYGFTHVAADDVYVFHATGESFGEVAKNQRKVDNDQLVSRRFPYWDQWIEDFIHTPDTPLERARHHAAASIHGFTIAVDAELIHPTMTGTFEGSLAISRSLAWHPQVNRVIWIASPGRTHELTQMLHDRGISTIEVATLEELRDSSTFIDVAFRPYQDYTGMTWSELDAVAHRSVIWHLDLIATQNPSYADDYQAYARLSETVAGSWESADAIGVLTPHVKQSYESFYGAGEKDGRVFVLPNGAPEDHGFSNHAWSVENPVIESLGDEPYVLFLGTNYRHKNVPWLMRIALRVKALGWPGRFVFAGPTPSSGETSEMQAELAELTGADCFSFVGRVSDADRVRLIRGAAAVASPSISEGWGMVPAEALLFGSLPIASTGGGLRDVTPDGARSFGLRDDAWDAELLYELLTDEQAREQQRIAWTAVMNHSWNESAQALVDASMAAFLRRRRSRPLPAPEPQELLEPEPDPGPEPSKARGPLANRLLIASTAIFPVGGRARRALDRMFGRIFHR